MDVPFRRDLTALRIGVSADVVAAVCLGALGIVAAAITWGTWGDLNADTGYDILAGIRLSHGHLPYADYVYYYGPLAPGVSALTVLLAGGGFGSAIGLGLVITAAIVAATYALARILVGPLGASLAAAITIAVAFIPNNFSYVLPHTESATLGTLTILGFLLALWRFETTRNSRWLVAAGIAAGLVALTKMEAEVGVAAAAVAWFAARGRSERTWRRDVLLLGLPAVLLPVLAYGAFLAKVSVHDLVFQNLYPVDELRAGGDKVLRRRTPMTIHSFAVVGARLLIYAVGAGLLLIAAQAFDRARRWRRPLVVAAVLVGLLALAGALAGVEQVRTALRFVYGPIPAAAALAVVVLFWRSRRRAAASTPVDRIALATAAALAGLAATTYAVFYLHTWVNEMAVYYAPFAAIFLARLHLVELARSRTAYVVGVAWIAFLAAAGLGLTIKDAGLKSATVRGPGGALKATPWDAAVYTPAVSAVTSRTRPGEPILVVPLSTSIYVLSGRANPLEDLSLLPRTLPSAADERATIARLERARVRVAVVDYRAFPAYGHTSFGGSFDRILAGWIRRNFTVAKTIRTGPPAPRLFRVWVRRLPAAG